MILYCTTYHTLHDDNFVQMEGDEAFRACNKDGIRNITRKELPQARSLEGGCLRVRLQVATMSLPTKCEGVFVVRLWHRHLGLGNR